MDCAFKKILLDFVIFPSHTFLPNLKLIPHREIKKEVKIHVRLGKKMKSNVLD